MGGPGNKDIIGIGAAEVKEDDEGLVVGDTGNGIGEGTLEEFEVGDGADDAGKAHGGAGALGHEGAAGVRDFGVWIFHGTGLFELTLERSGNRKGKGWIISG
jgi:hypothetical protein